MVSDCYGNHKFNPDHTLENLLRATIAVKVYTALDFMTLQTSSQSCNARSGFHHLRVRTKLGVFYIVGYAFNIKLAVSKSTIRKMPYGFAIAWQIVSPDIGVVAHRRRKLNI